MMWELDDLATASQLADEYGVSRSTMSNWSSRYPDFPAPLIAIGGCQVFSRAQVAEWVKANCDQADNIR